MKIIIRVFTYLRITKIIDDCYKSQQWLNIIIRVFTHLRVTLIIVDYYKSLHWLKIIIKHYIDWKIIIIDTSMIEDYYNKHDNDSRLL